MTTKVAHVKSIGWSAAAKRGEALYIGRANPRMGFADSGYGNPFKIGEDGTRAVVLRKFEKMLRDNMRDNPRLIHWIRRDMKDKTLGCYCKPLDCHGDVLARLADATDEEYEEWLNAG